MEEDPDRYGEEEDSCNSPEDAFDDFIHSLTQEQCKMMSVLLYESFRTLQKMGIPPTPPRLSSRVTACGKRSSSEHMLCVLELDVLRVDITSLVTCYKQLKDFPWTCKTSARGVAPNPSITPLIVL